MQAKNESGPETVKPEAQPPREWTRRCGLNTPWRRTMPYTEPCASGWCIAVGSASSRGDGRDQTPCEPRHSRREVAADNQGRHRGQAGRSDGEWRSRLSSGHGAYNQRKYLGLNCGLPFGAAHARRRPALRPCRKRDFADGHQGNRSGRVRADLAARTDAHNTHPKR